MGFVDRCLFQMPLLGHPNRLVIPPQAQELPQSQSQDAGKLILYLTHFAGMLDCKFKEGCSKSDRIQGIRMA